MSNNPIINIDPNGNLDYYSERGKKVGTDGCDDGRIAVVTSKQIVRQMRKETRKGLLVTDAPNDENIIELPSAASRAKMYESVVRVVADEKNRPNEGVSHEEGGVWGNKNGVETVVEAKPGPTTDLNKGELANVDPFDAKVPSEAEGVEVSGTYHVHPNVQTEKKPDGSYTIGGPGPSGIPGGKKGGGDYRVQKDAEKSGTLKGKYSLILAPRDNQVTIYNSNKVLGTFPLKKFKLIGNEPKKK